MKTERGVWEGRHEGIGPPVRVDSDFAGCGADGFWGDDKSFFLKLLY